MIDLSKKKVVVTGSGGVLGYFVLQKLLKRGVSAEQIQTPRQRDLDLRVWENCLHALRSADIVIHLAAATGNLELHRDRPGSIFYDNLMMGVHLLEAARQSGVEKFVGIGTAAEYPETTPTPFKEENLWQGYPQALHAPYALAKKMLLVQGQAYRAEYGFKAIHLLLTNIYGPQERVESGYVIPSIIKKIIEAQQKNLNFIEIWGSGRSERDFLYAEDAAEGVLLAAEKYDEGEPVNLGSGHGVAIRDLVQKLCEIMDYRGEIRYDTEKPEGHLRRVLDMTKTKEGFGFEPVTTLEEGLERTAEWFREVYHPA